MAEQRGGESADADADISFPHANIEAITAISSILEPTYGPGGSYKLLHRHEERESDAPYEVPDEESLVVSGDGRTILEELPLVHPVASVVRRVGGPAFPGETEVEGEMFPDGVSASLVLVARLLSAAEDLLEKGLHQTTIQEGYHAACTLALEELEELREVDATDADLEAVARTTITNADFGGKTDTWARFAVDVADGVGMPTPTNLSVRTTPKGAPGDLRLVTGAVLDRNEVASREMPRTILDARVLVLDGEAEGGLRNPEEPDNWQYDLSSPAQLKEYARHNQERRERVVARLVDAGVSVVVARQGIDREYRRRLADEGILGVRGVAGLDLEQVATATGASPVKKTDDFDASDFGHAGVVREEVLRNRETQRSNRRMVVFDDCRPGGARSVVLTGIPSYAAEQSALQIRKAAGAVAAVRGIGRNPPGYLPGGGATEAALARRLREGSVSLDSRAQLAVDAFADTLEELVRVLVTNCGRDSLDTMATLRSRNAADEWVGFHFPSNDLRDVRTVGLLDPYAVKQRMLDFAVEVAILVLRIDDAIDATFTESPAGPGESIHDDVAERHM